MLLTLLRPLTPSGFNLSTAFLLLSISRGVLPHEPGPDLGFVLFRKHCSCHCYLSGRQAEDNLDCGYIKKVKSAHCILASSTYPQVPRSQQRGKKTICCHVTWGCERPRCNEHFFNISELATVVDGFMVYWLWMGIPQCLVQCFYSGPERTNRLSEIHLFSSRKAKGLLIFQNLFCPPAATVGSLTWNAIVVAGCNHT